MTWLEGIVLCLLVFALPMAPRAQDGGAMASTPDFQILWSTEVGPGSSHMMIIQDGTVYAQVTDGSLVAVDLKTGRVRTRAAHVGVATGPFVVGDWVYSWRPGGLTELNRFSLEPRRDLRVYNGSYFENVPYDREADAFFVRLTRPGTDSADDFAAYSREDGRELWSHRFPGRGWENNNGSALLAGDDSVYIQCANMTNWMYRFDKRTGEVRWVTELGLSRVLQFNNPIYDRRHDQIYASCLNGEVFALRRTDGAIQWSRHFPSGLRICSTLTYHAGIVYIPLWNPTGTGAVAALNAVDGSEVWFQNGFDGEDGWSANAVCDRYLYRSSHGTTPSRIMVQDRFTGKRVWSADGTGIGECTNPIASDGIVVFGTSARMIALKVGNGLPVNSAWHGVNATGYNPGAVIWEESPRDPDVDEDGLPDIWELATFRHLFQQGSDDYDGDGLDNRTEWQLGLDALAAEPQDLGSFQGERARFKVTTNGVANLRFQWFRDGKEVPGATNSSVEIGPLTLEDSGSRWSVQLRSEQGAFESRTAGLKVGAAPSWAGAIKSMGLAKGRVSGQIVSEGSTPSLDILTSANLQDWKVVQRVTNPSPSLSFSAWVETLSQGYYTVRPTPPVP
ncbi:MAG: PQQ-like beta-propeller repeat protein [Verrucomicrobiae bacterium]|nr:PQQ-like beta-propeller repeat protein [Verrucomicrobiae bacterium]